MSGKRCILCNADGNGGDMILKVCRTCVPSAMNTVGGYAKACEGGYECDICGEEVPRMSTSYLRVHCNGTEIHTPICQKNICVENYNYLAQSINSFREPTPKKTIHDKLNKPVEDISAVKHDAL